MLRRPRNPAIVPDAGFGSMHYQADDATQPGGWRCGEFLIEPARRRLLRAGALVELEERTFDLIALLAANHDRAIDRREITCALWGTRPVSETTLRQVVYKARQALGDDGRRQGVIRTLHGRSLRWVAPIEAVIASPAAEPAAGLQPSRPPPARRAARVACASIAVLLAVLALAIALPRRSPKSSAAPVVRVAILPFDNATGQTDLDWTRNGMPGLLASLLDQDRVDVVNPRSVAQAFAYAKVAGMTRDQQLRAATGARALIGGRLGKVGELYELSLNVEAAGEPARTLQLTGERPASLVAAAAPRVRRALGVDEPPTVPADAPADPFAAEAYARGTDAGARGRMEEARTYFEACVDAAPAFLPGRFGLGVARIATHDLDRGEETLRGVLAAAEKRDDARLIARTLDELAYAAIMRHRFVDARELLARADGAVARTSDPDVAVTHALRRADVEGRLEHVDAARSALERARALIEQRGLSRRKADLLNAEAILAEARGQKAEAERARRAALAASEAIGNERDAAGDAYNLGRSLLADGRRDEALILLARAYERAGAEDAWLSFGAGDNLAIALLDSGLDQRAGAVAARIGALAERQGNRAWQTLAQLLDGAIAIYRGDAAQAHAAFERAERHSDAPQDARLAAGTLLYLATASWAAAPGEVGALAQRVDALVAEHADIASLRYPQELVHALDAARRDDAGEARRALQAAAASPHPDDAAGNDLTMVALTLAQRAPAAADAALASFDVRRCDDATILRLYARAAAARGDVAASDRAEHRIDTLRSDAMRALAQPALSASAADAHAASVASQ